MPLTQIKTSNLDSGNSLNFRNRVINGDMRIDQRNSGASVTTSTLQATAYFVDRWYYYCDQASKLTLQRVTDAPVGFSTALKATVISADTTGPEQLIRQRIEGYNIADLGWGTSSAKTCTLSFWAKSSVTGQMGGSVCSGNLDNCYPFAYTINSANTWEYKTVVVTGPTTGTFDKTNGVGMHVSFELGVGYQKQPANAWWPGNSTSSTGSVNLTATNGATWFVTGVQLEVGTTATAFENLPYGTQLQLCQRYYWQSTWDSTNESVATSAYWSTSTNVEWITQHPVPMRTAPTFGATPVAALYALEPQVAWRAFSTLGANELGPNRAKVSGAAATNTSYTKGQGCAVGFRSAGYLWFTSEL